MFESSVSLMSRVTLAIDDGTGSILASSHDINTDFHPYSAMIMIQWGETGVRRKGRSKNEINHLMDIASIMYMMLAGKAEINRLNTAVDETAKVAQELKAEISKRKSSSDFMVEATVYQKGVDIKLDQSFLKKSSMVNDDIDVGYASNIHIEEPQQNVLEMDQLEAELECELLKLHVSATDTSYSFQLKA
ncbi:hypothetical protein CTI12_AA597990 [Artemisia annua]|uniref:Uncharacterized protein n=1 Tax=Artemisia annua TaxID=35608 RepID=A0A2U1KIT3_ARTAN|nr:hypothetical protein CTI12_AA597990 [Artemisia annua]